jgi:adenylosuccinate lyase
MGESMTYPDHERAMRIAEWPSLSEACMMTGSVLFVTQNLVKGMTVHEEKMKKNLNMLKGLLLTERVMFVVADKIGRQSAHDIVYKISMKSFEQDIPFIDALMSDEYIATHVTRAELEEALDPQTYTNLAEQLVEDVLNYVKSAQ